MNEKAKRQAPGIIHFLVYGRYTLNTSVSEAIFGRWTNWNIKMSLDTLKLSVYLPYTRKGIPPFDATD